MVAAVVARHQFAAVVSVGEEDGLAMSSRNRYLSADERRRALILSRTLEAAQHLVKTLCEVSEAKVSGRINSSAAFVITTRTCMLCRCRARTSSADL